nr:HIG1 domain family member 2A, mitochondrial-like [Procambarus clarkii]
MAGEEGGSSGPAASHGHVSDDDLDWITLRNDINAIQVNAYESPGNKFWKKFQENPLVPVGCGLTTAALCIGLRSLSTGQRKTSQAMMRFRVLAQGFTVVALMLGVLKTSMH